MNRPCAKCGNACPEHLMIESMHPGEQYAGKLVHISCEMDLLEQAMIAAGYDVTTLEREVVL